MEANGQKYEKAKYTAVRLGSGGTDIKAMTLRHGMWRQNLKEVLLKISKFL